MPGGRRQQQEETSSLVEKLQLPPVSPSLSGKQDTFEQRDLHMDFKDCKCKFGEREENQKKNQVLCLGLDDALVPWQSVSAGQVRSCPFITPYGTIWPVWIKWI